MCGGSCYLGSGEKSGRYSVSRLSVSAFSLSASFLSLLCESTLHSYTAPTLSMPLCSLMRCPECWQQSQTCWNDNLGAAWMSSTQDQPSGPVLFSWKRTPLCHVMGRRGEGRGYGNSASPPTADHRSPEKEGVNY